MLESIAAGDGGDRSGSSEQRKSWRCLERGGETVVWNVGEEIYMMRACLCVKLYDGIRTYGTFKIEIEFRPCNSAPIHIA